MENKGKSTRFSSSIMHQNSLPAGLQNLIGLASKISDGLIAHGPWLGLTEPSSEQLAAAIHQLKDTQETFANAQSARNLAVKRVMLADKALKSWLGKARLTVMLARGARWSESWVHTGFTQRRTHIPKRAESRATLARSLVSFFARHPEFSVPFANVTATHGRSLYERLTQSQEMLHVLNLDRQNALHRRENSKSALTDLIRQIVILIGTKLDNLDPRWNNFGLSPRRCRSRRDVLAGNAGQSKPGMLVFTPAKEDTAPQKTAAA